MVPRQGPSGSEGPRLPSLVDDARVASGRLVRSALHVGASIRRRPATGGRFALVMPAASTAVMNIFREGFRGKLLDDEQAVMVRDKAGWHRANDLRVRF